MAYITHGKYTFRVTDHGVWLTKASPQNISDPEYLPAYQMALKEYEQRSRRKLKARTRPAFVYIGIGACMSQGFKIGSSYNPDSRLDYFTRRILLTIECSNRQAAFDLEYQLHKHFADKAVFRQNEWFELDASDIEYIKSIGEKG